MFIIKAIFYVLVLCYLSSLVDAVKNNPPPTGECKDYVMVDPDTGDVKHWRVPN
jgi:hypothetical protein